MVAVRFIMASLAEMRRMLMHYARLLRRTRTGYMRHKYIRPHTLHSLRDSGHASSFLSRTATNCQLCNAAGQPQLPCPYGYWTGADRLEPPIHYMAWGKIVNSVWGLLRAGAEKKLVIVLGDPGGSSDPWGTATTGEVFGMQSCPWRGHYQRIFHLDTGLRRMLTFERRDLRLSLFHIYYRRIPDMILKKLEIQGFKSFAERTEVSFSPGVIAVEGPNGSGKSNISDAIL